MARREFARATPEGRALDTIADDTAYSEALDALAERIPEAEFAHLAPACARPKCALRTIGEERVETGTP